MVEQTGKGALRLRSQKLVHDAGCLAALGSCHRGPGHSSEGRKFAKRLNVDVPSKSGLNPTTKRRQPLLIYLSTRG